MNTPTTGIPPESSSRIVVSDPSFGVITGRELGATIPQDYILPRTIDDVERDIGTDIYRLMCNDAIVWGSLAYLKYSTLVDGLTVAPAVPKPNPLTATQDDLARFDMSCKIADFVRYALSNLEDHDAHIIDVLDDLLWAMRDGHRIAEATYEVSRGGEWADKFVFQSILGKPRQNYAFIVDKLNKVTGIMGIMPGIGLTIRGGVVSDPSEITNVLAPSKVLRLTLGGENGSPIGKSFLRPAYDPWWRKKAAKSEDVKAAIQFGGGKILIKLPPNASEGVRAALLRDASAWTSGGVLAVPAEAEATSIASDSKDYFDGYFRRCNVEIATGVMIAARSLLEAEHGSKADTDKSENILDDVRGYLRGSICRRLKILFRHLVSINFGPDIARQFTPNPTMMRAAKADFPMYATSLAAVGYRLAEEHLPEVDTWMGLAPRAEHSSQETAEDENE